MESSSELRILYEKNEKDVFRNLALEEAILLSLNEGNSSNTFRLWLNDSSAIAPFHESIFDLIDVEFCLDEGINIARRITGGGAIYNDCGNLNWSFFFNRKPFEKYSLKDLYSYFSSFIIKSLTQVGIDLNFHEPNWLGYEGKKVSGMAGYLKNNAILIHGTLLISADLTKLERVCKQHYKYPPVLNLSSIKPLDTEKVANIILGSIEETFQSSFKIHFDTSPNEREEQLLSGLKEKYSSIAWVFEK
ncbi:MAG TPA: lipoate--protein ligase family protein [Geobacterales bacterium]|nr:lipoate--protein ligase family protein [Geobacterales bacterium]